ncbi:MAG: dTDP-4-dehydrorhamnose 3,5-epimerase [Chroococcidiopsis sp. SAG 2025]|uniref:dTDP-4-dehydrorhamnose 3,5-epimerase n=1 Tax=Chroococcidiopsis sp. SAG 2025 TaxID=171389 RepID=UPI002936FB0F|nr:dTDP-4-dehydrorhamnose 3,5-epimerase [Chroococcidiopsis sp. SAG 2025]MDV2990608.1 dTDP-4-dehydrorhamnose 3,5-epimerase [Chroococcidiopsis sp. SAG 2025]
MLFTETALQGAYIIDIEPKEDSRGFFARTFCDREFAALGLEITNVQCSIAFNHKKGTLRGMHYQAAPATEAKLVRCTQGAIYDCIVDLRLDSPTYLSHICVELTADNHRALYIPEMFAHGYQTLDDNTEIAYQMNKSYTPGYERGLRYNDPILDIQWQLPVSEISRKDLEWDLLETVLIK